MYILGFDLSDKWLHHIMVPLSTETGVISNDTCPWSDELSDKHLYEVVAQLSNGN